MNVNRKIRQSSLKMPGQDTRRHPEIPPYRCFLSDLTGFVGLRRAGPTRTLLSILHALLAVNRHGDMKQAMLTITGKKPPFDVYLIIIIMMFKIIWRGASQ